MALPLGSATGNSEDYNAFLTIQEDGTVTCHIGVIEMGQGPITSLPQQVADELDVSLESVKMVMGDTMLCPYMQGPGDQLPHGSTVNHLRAACAEARAVLLQLGSEYLDIPVNTESEKGCDFRCIQSKETGELWRTGQRKKN